MIQLWNTEDEWRRPEFVRERRADLIWHNRRVAAEREHWPAGALQMCEHLDAVHPGWSVHWRCYLNIPGWYHPPGYVARRESSGYVCGIDPAALVAAMAAAPAERHWHYHPACCDLYPRG